MRFRAPAVAGCLLTVAALASSPSGIAISIEGLRPLTPLTLHHVSASVKHKTLEIRYPGGQLSIQPWPEFLPQNLTEQVLQAERQTWPAGPSDRVSFTHSGEQHPWLIIGSQSRSSEHVLGGWHLERIDVNWYVSKGEEKTLLAEKGREGRAPSGIVACSERWYVYRLSTSNKTPPASSSISIEREPRISWVAVRQDR